MSWYCKDRRRQFTTKLGTIFEDSPIAFTKWLPGIWLLASNRNDISSCEIARGLGVTQKTAWFMLQRIREAMATESYEAKLQGTVEADETHLGGKWENRSKARQKHRSREAVTAAKTPVFGIVERGGRVRA